MNDNKIPEIKDVHLTTQDDGKVVEVPDNYRLINNKAIPELIVKHDFRSQGWGKSIQGMKSSVLEFDVLHTQRFTGSMFYYFPMAVGDFILLPFESGRTAVLEVKRFVKHSEFQPGGNDYYDFTADFCG